MHTVLEILVPVLKPYLLSSWFRKHKADMKRFLRREAEIQHEVESKVKEWSIRKGLQEEMETMKKIQSLEKRKAMAIQSRIK